MASSLAAQQPLPSQAVAEPSEFSTLWSGGVKSRDAAIASAARLKGPGVPAGAGIARASKTPAPSLARGRLLRAFAGRVGRLDALSKSYLIIERSPNILLPFCYPTR